MLKKIVERIEQELKQMEDVRDNIIRESRDIVRLSREIVHLVHRGDLEEAEKRISKLSELVREIIRKARQYPQLYYSGLICGPLIEYVEAVTLYKIVTEDKIPSPEELEVENVPYLLGLGDVVGELRRIIIEALRRGADVRDVEKYFKYMEEIYEALSLIVVPDALVPGLRGKVDFIRKMVEVTRADLYLATLRFVPRTEEDTNEK
ncbi:MAG: haloacid dehalogenase [Crenarchaeota archaeon]|nr:haloacid dehalogenase [Thermoproteota archaeon]